MSETLPPTLTVDDYHRLITAGILTEEDRVELLEGYLVRRAPRTPGRAVAVGLVLDALRVRLPKGWHLRRPTAITTGDSEPEPELTVVRNHPRFYVSRHPGPEEVAIVIEVTDIAPEQTGAIKERVYAKAMIGEYWLVNLVHRRVEVYTDPTGPDPAPAYRRRDDYGPADAVPLAIAGSPTLNIPVAELLP